MEIQGYRLQFGLKNTSLNGTVDFQPQERNFTVRNLSPGSSYIFVLSAKSRAGYGSATQQEIAVPMCPPSGYPKIIDFVNATCCSLQFSWLPPAPDECSSAVTEYTVAYRKVSNSGSSALPASSDPPWLITLPASESSYTILGLNHSTAYEVQLRAHNQAGPGPFSPPLLYLTLAFETGRAGRGPGGNTFQLLSTGSTSLLPSSWSPPPDTKLKRSLGQFLQVHLSPTHPPREGVLQVSEEHNCSHP